MDKPKTQAKDEPPNTPDTLAHPGEDTGIELTEEDLKKVAGGASDIFAKLGDIKGSSSSRRSR
jgi:hypothetical protein